MSSEYLNNKTFENIIARFQQAKQMRSKHEIIFGDFSETIDRLRKRDAILEWHINAHTVSENEFNVSHTNFKAAQSELANAFYTLSNNIVRYAKFYLIDADDAVQEGVMICFEKIDRFDPKKGKAFNYMTTCILNHFRQLYRTARNYNELKRKYHDFLQTKADHTVVISNKGRRNPAYASAINSL